MAPRPPLERSLPLDPRITDVDGAGLPVWTPSLGRAKPPFPLTLAQAEIKGGKIEHKRALTAKQYQQSSQLLSILKDDNSSNEPKTLLPTDLPAIHRLVTGVTQVMPRSDSEGAVTSRNLPLPQKENATATVKTQYDDTELETMLEETLQEEEEGAEQTNAAPKLDGSNTVAVGEQAMRLALEAMGYESLEALLMASKNTISTKRRGRGRGKPKVADVLNPNSAIYHAGFARAYQQARDSLARADLVKRKAAALEEHTALPGHRWSSLSAADHTWYLKHQGVQLVGSNAERFATLHARVLLEREQYWKMIHSEALQHRVRFDYLSERQGAQLRGDDDLRRRRVCTVMPRYYRRVSSAIKLSFNPSDGENSGVMTLWRHLRSMGRPPTLSTTISQWGFNSLSIPLPGYKFYLPAIHAVTVDTWAPDSIGYRKNKPAEVWDDVTMEDVIVNQVMKEIQVESEAVDAAFKTGVVTAAAAGAIECLLRSGVSEGKIPWEIPVVITCSDDRRVDVPAAKRVYLGKPLLARKEPLREKQRRLQKYAALTALLERKLEQEENEQKEKEEEEGSKSHDCNAREARYSLWMVGGQVLVIRSHAKIAIPHILNAPTYLNTNNVAFTVKTEYLPEPDREEDTAEELSKWWSKLVVNQDGVDALLVGHAHVPRATLIGTRLMTLKDIQEECKKTFKVENGFSFVAAVLAHLARLAPGKYVLTHAGGGKDKAWVWKAVEEEEGLKGLPVEQVPPLPMEISEQQFIDTDESERRIVDLHAAHSTSGAVDTSVNPFIPPKWRPFKEEVAQIPYTFPPSAASVKRSKSEKSKGPKKRSRSLAWQGDMDRVQHIATLSRAEYAAGLEEEL